VEKHLRIRRAVEWWCCSFVFRSSIRSFVPSPTYPSPPARRTPPRRTRHRYAVADRLEKLGITPPAAAQGAVADGRAAAARERDDGETKPELGIKPAAAGAAADGRRAAAARERDDGETKRPASAPLAAAPPAKKRRTRPPLPVVRSLADEIAKLGALRAQGLLSEDEFRAAKAKLLAPLPPSRGRDGPEDVIDLC
jgi:hypothetical protein